MEKETANGLDVPDAMIPDRMDWVEHCVAGRRFVRQDTILPDNFLSGYPPGIKGAGAGTMK